MHDPNIKFVSPRGASELTSLSTRQLSRLVEAGQFPTPLRLGQGPNGRLASVESEIRAWLHDRVAERDSAPSIRRHSSDNPPSATEDAA